MAVRWRCGGADDDDDGDDDGDNGDDGDDDKCDDNYNHLFFIYLFICKIYIAHYSQFNVL